MKTSELIAALAADPTPSPIHLGRRVVLALALGGVVSLAVFMMMSGPRPDIHEAMRTMRFDLKFLDCAALLLPSALLVYRLARPDARPGALALALASPLVLLLFAVLIELALVPRAEWGQRMIGENALYCLTMIPMMAAAPLAALIFVMREGAPQSPAWTGALAGMAAAGVAALIYASHCPDDSPLFVATWYPLATAICAGAGALAGHRFLQW